MHRRTSPSQFLFITWLLAIAAVSAVAQDLSIYERVLVPITVSRIPGAYGSLWSTELWYRNNSDLPVQVFPLAESDAVPTIRRTVRLRTFVGTAYDPGEILYLSRDGGDQAQFDLRLFNEGDPSGSWGTKLPVVRECEFAQTVNLINVPTGAQYRSALRIYGLAGDLLSGETVAVRIYGDNERLLVSTDLTLSGYPRYAAILSLGDTFPEIRQAERVRVEVESRDTDVKIWAFAAVVSNSTQHVAIVTQD